MAESLIDILNGMKLLPWKFFLLSGEQFLSKFLITSASYCIILSDLNYFYFEYLASSEIECKFEELNPGMEMPLYRILSLIEKILPYSEENEAPKIHSLEKNGSKEILLRSETTVAGISFIWQFRLTECDKLLKEQFLQPLIGMIAELQQRQIHLISLIKKKDIEIEDYKEAGAKVSRKYLETSKFDEHKFLIDRSCPQLLSEIVRNSMKTTFDQVNEEFYVAVATAQKHIVEELQSKKALEGDQLLTAKNEQSEGKIDSNQPVERDEDKEIARRKELEQKLLAKPAKKKKKIAF